MVESFIPNKLKRFGLEFNESTSGELNYRKQTYQKSIHDFDKNDSNKKSTLVDNRTVVVIIDESTQTCSLVVHWPRFFSACMDS